MAGYGPFISGVHVPPKRANKESVELFLSKSIRSLVISERVDKKTTSTITTILYEAAKQKYHHCFLSNYHSLVAYSVRICPLSVIDSHLIIAAYTPTTWQPLWSQ